MKVRLKLVPATLLYHWPDVSGLSPVGIAHFYRQLYFNVSEGVGPVEDEPADGALALDLEELVGGAAHDRGTSAHGWPW